MQATTGCGSRAQKKARLCVTILIPWAIVQREDLLPPVTNVDASVSFLFHYRALKVISLKLAILSVMLTSNPESKSFVVSSAKSTLPFLPQRLPPLKETLIHCLFGERWCPIVMSTAMMPLNIYLERENWKPARCSVIQRFLHTFSRKSDGSSKWIISDHLASGWLDSSHWLRYPNPNRKDLPIEMAWIIIPSWSEKRTPRNDTDNVRYRI